MFTNFTNNTPDIRDIRGSIRADLQSGFTLAELVVAMGVFVVLVTIAVGVFVNAVRNQRRLTELMAVSNNAGGIVEQIAREARTGYRFCNGTVPEQNPSAPCALDNVDTLSFTNYAGRVVHYLVENGEVKRQVEGVDNNPVPLTAPEVEVTYLTFSVTQRGQDGVSANDVCVPWRITVVMGVLSRNPALADRGIKLQTTISSRVFPAEAPNAPESIIQACQ